MYAINAIKNAIKILKIIVEIKNFFIAQKI